jgi:hypothetical protein
MATPEKQPGLSFFFRFAPDRSKIFAEWNFCALETGNSPRKLGSLPNYFVAALQTALESRRLEILKALG